jgi:hypothetical protein
VCALSRRRRYAPSEREAEFAIRSIFRILIFAFGSLLALFALSKYLMKRNDDDDLLEPVKLQSDLVYAFSNLPEKTKYCIGAFAVLIPISVGVIYLHQTLRLGMVGHLASVIVTVLTLLSPVAAVATYKFDERRAWQLYRRYPVDYDPPNISKQRNEYRSEPARYRTLFRDGSTAFYDRDLLKVTTYTIRVPRGMEWNAERSTRLVEQLMYSFAPLWFRIYADDRSIAWQVVDILCRDPEQIESAIRISYPEADVRVDNCVPEHQTQPRNFYRLNLLYRAGNEFIFPMKYITDVKDFDPLTTVVSAMNGLQEGERIVYTLFVAGGSPNAHERGKQLITTSTITPFDYFSGQGLQRIATLKSLNLDRIEKYVPMDQKVGEEKLRHALYQALFAVQVDSPIEERILTLGQNIDSQLYGFAHLPYNGLQWYTGIESETGDGERIPPDPQSLIFEENRHASFLSSVLARIVELTEHRAFRDVRKATKLILGSREIALLWHLPNDTFFTASRINWLSSRTVPPPTTVIYQDAQESVQLGHGTSGGKLFPIHLPLKDRENHIRIVGKAGVGKSSLMYDLIMQDIRKGYGVAVIDPHGSLVQNILETEMTPEEIQRVVVLDLSDKDTPPPLNPLRGGLGHVRVGQIVQSIERIYPTTRQYPRLSYYLRIALLTLNADPNATLKDVVRLFTDQTYRDHIVNQLNDAELRGAWEEFDHMKDGEKRTITDPIRTRMSPFYSNPDLTAIMCHPDSLDFRQMIRERKIILVSLKMDEERVPETERDLIGALLISRLQMSGMYDQGGVPYFVYIDEVQRLVTSSLDKMFAEARKFGLSLTVAHQYLEQLPDTTQSAIIGNAGASIIFACSPKDAQVFQPFTRPAFEVDDIVNLDQFTAVIKMQCEGVSQPAFTLLTPLPQVERPEEVEKIPVFHRRASLNPDLLRSQTFVSRKRRKALAEHVRMTSHANYTPKKREEVNAWLRQRYGLTVKLDDQTQFYDADIDESSPSDSGLMNSNTVTAD